MEFSFTTKRIFDNLNNVIKDIEHLSNLISKESNVNKKVLESMKNIKDNININFKPIQDFIENNKNKIEAIEFLINGFNIEYESIIGYRSCIEFIDDQVIKEKMKIIFEEETKHMVALHKLIGSFGGVVPINYSENNVLKDKVSLKKIVEEFINTEKTAIDFYEKGLGSFNIAELQWTIGNIKIDEEKHLSLLQEVKNIIGDKDILIDTSVKGWIDPYMGKPGDRPWIEG